MGIRLVRYGLEKAPSAGTYDHKELLNRDAADSHPISAITGLDTALQEVTKAIDDSSEVIKTELETYIDEAVKNNGGLNFGEISTQTMKLVYDRDQKTLRGDVIIAPLEDNAIEIAATGGLFVDKYNKVETVNTASVTLDMNENGQTLKDIFTNGKKFNHSPTSWSDVFNQTELTYWRYFESNDSLEPVATTGYFGGMVSTISYESYIHQVSVGFPGGTPTGFNGIIVGYVIDTDGKPHTLSYGINSSGANFYPMYYGFIYDQGLPDQQILFENSRRPAGIYGTYPRSFVMRVEKRGSKITCACSDSNSTEINVNTKIEINLDDYEWGNLFAGLVQYGYCNHYQSNSYFRNLYFKGNGRLKADVNISKTTGNSLELKDDGLFVNAAATNHNDLGGRSATDAHPISAITGLQPLCDEMTAAVNRVNDISFSQKTTNKGSAELLNQIESFSALNATTNGNGRTTSIRRSIVLKEDISNYDTIDFILAINDGTNVGLISKRISLARNKIAYNNTVNINQTDGSFIGLIVSAPSTASGGFGVFNLAIQGWFKSPTEFYVYQTVNSTTNSTYNNINILSIQGVISTIIVDPVQYVDEQSGLQDEPIGHILQHMGTKAPKHHLICDGSVYNITDYPYLAEHFKTDFGSYNYFGGDGILTFAVPDLRNEFLRGYHGDKAQQFSGEIGIHQDATKMPRIGLHSGSAYIYRDNSKLGIDWGDITTGVMGGDSDESFKSSAANIRYGSIGGVNTSSTLQPYAYSIRPNNVAVLYCIKYEPTFYLNIDMPDTLKDLKEQNDLLRQQIQQLSEIIDNINRVVI